MTPDPLATQVAWACRILAAHGYEDLTLGHVSARRDEEHGVMWIKRKGVSLAEVSPGDVLRFPIDGDLESAHDMHLEAVLHTEVYRCRPDVRCVVHGHPVHATALGAAHADFAFLSHDSVLFKEGLASLEEYDRERAHVRSLHRALIAKGCPPLDIERELAATDAEIAEHR